MRNSVHERAFSSVSEPYWESSSKEDFVVLQDRKTYDAVDRIGRKKNEMPEDPRYAWLGSYYEFRKMQASRLKWAGMWKLDSRSGDFSKGIYSAYKMAVVGTLFVFATTLFVDICLTIDDLMIVTDDGCVFAGIFVVIFKVMNYQFRRERIDRFINETFDSAEDLCRLAAGSCDFRRMLDFYLLRDKVVYYAFSLLGFLLTVALIFLVPTKDGELPIRARYPFDTTTSPWHEVGLLIEAFSVSYGMAAILQIDVMITSSCNLLTLQYAILGMKFENCHEAEDNGGDTASTTGRQTDGRKRCDFVRRYKKCLRHHQRLTAIVDDFNELFNGSMFVQMFSSTSMICLTGFQAVVIVGDSTNAVKFLIYLSAAVGQLFYVCWVGNELMYQSSSLVESQWLSEWNGPPIAQVGRMLTLSLMFSNKSSRLKAGKFFTMSFETFITIMRGSYSFFALLDNMHSDSER